MEDGTELDELSYDWFIDQPMVMVDPRAPRYVRYFLFCLSPDCVLMHCTYNHSPSGQGFRAFRHSFVVYVSFGAYRESFNCV